MYGYYNIRNSINLDLSSSALNFRACLSRESLNSVEREKSQCLTTALRNQETLQTAHDMKSWHQTHRHANLCRHSETSTCGKSTRRCFLVI